eukprot:TRINITY_DN124076_c0_g1_i1.p1 TRINITY_DN124076_c0_g1~~TRINITY_DN124076_c0_g1_i1.p1  ORF type:complete len:191 (+),score=48.25 TRINITY_DN124076_c0_g1_i1:102-674(+)
MGKTATPPEIDDKYVGSLYSRVDLVKILGEYINDALTAENYAEDHFWMNWRILLCTLCCGFGCYVQFGVKFPDDRWIIGAGVAAYFICSGILTLLDMFIIKGSVMCIKIADDSVMIDVELPPFTPKLKLNLRSKTKTVTHETTVAKYFDTTGLLRQENLFADLMSLIEKYQAAPEGTGRETEKKKKEKGN